MLSILLVQQNEFTWNLLEIVTFWPLVPCFILKLFYEFLSCICIVKMLWNSLIQLSRILYNFIYKKLFFYIFNRALWFTLSLPNNPFMAIISLKKLHFENSDWRYLVIADIFIYKNTRIILTNMNISNFAIRIKGCKDILLLCNFIIDEIFVLKTLLRILILSNLHFIF